MTTRRCRTRLDPKGAAAVDLRADGPACPSIRTTRTARGWRSICSRARRWAAGDNGSLQRGITIDLASRWSYTGSVCASGWVSPIARCWATFATSRPLSRDAARAEHPASSTTPGRCSATIGRTQAALQRHYQARHRPTASTTSISSMPSAHPWEDFAETLPIISTSPEPLRPSRIRVLSRS